MTVTLLSNTDLSVCDIAISKCWGTACKTGEDMKERIDRVGNKHKHGSTLEHLTYSFNIDGISRACLQELARHRIASLSVKSTRYTLKELKDEPFADADDDTIESIINKYLVRVDGYIDSHNYNQLEKLHELLRHGSISNDKAKYMLPEAYKTSLVWTANARSIQNFLSLRTDKSALWEIRDMAKAIYDALPEDHKFIFEDCVK